MRKVFKKLLTVALVSGISVTSVVGVATMTGCGKSGGYSEFTYFIAKDDSNGQYYYENYNQSLVVQYLNMLSWDVENGGLAEKGEGENVKLKFQTPAVSAADELQVMFAGGDTTDLIDLAQITDSPKQLVSEHVLMEITEYVEKYMPNYVAYLNANPDVKKFVTEKDENGKYHYYALYQVADEPNDNFEGFMYRRDWLVKYAEVPTHVWADDIIPDKTDFTSAKASVDSGKIHYTNYFEAKAKNDWTGWKESGVTAFTSSDGADPDDTYTDNVIFPSGNTDPYYVSDWEWMLDAFIKATGSALKNTDKDKYSLSLYQWGVYGPGDFFSSFGGGNPVWYVNSEGTVKMGAATTTMKAYLECMHEWYSRGYVDSVFEQRSGDFWKVNLDGFTSGKVGMGQYGMAYPGTSIRATAKDDWSKQHAMVWGCPNPINDMYGEAENKFTTPDAMYSASKIGSPTGIALTAKNKNLPALFTMLDWLYTEEGARLLSWGLTGEQYQDLKEHGIEGKDYYAQWGLTGGTTTIGEDGKYKRIPELVEDTNLQGAANGQRIMTTMQINSRFDSGYKFALRHAMDLWRMYYNSTDITNYANNLSIDDAKVYNGAASQCQTLLAQSLPNFVKKGVSDSDLATFTRNLQIRGANATTLLQAIVDKLG